MRPSTRTPAWPQAQDATGDDGHQHARNNFLATTAVSILAEQQQAAIPLQGQGRQLHPGAGAGGDESELGRGQHSVSRLAERIVRQQEAIDGQNGAIQAPCRALARC